MCSSSQGSPKIAEVRRRAYRARLYLTEAQAVALDRQGHTARALWNLLHDVVHVGWTRQQHR